MHDLEMPDPFSGVGVQREDAVGEQVLPMAFTATQVAIAVGAGLTLFLTATAGALWRALGCVLWNRLIVLAVTLGALALGTFDDPIQILAVACGGLITIVLVEQVTVRRQLARRELRVAQVHLGAGPSA